MRLEPESLSRSFVDHPPAGFSASRDINGIPLFTTDYDLLTTVTQDLRSRIARWPLYFWWRRLLFLRVTFVGTTVTEYVQLPIGINACKLVQDLLDANGSRHPLLIIKDLPAASPLLCDQGNDLAAAVKLSCTQAGFVLVAGQALAYVRMNFSNIDQYLAARSPGRRRDLRRKLRSRQLVQVAVLPTGSASFDDDSLLAEMYEMYLAVFAQSEIQFDLLTPQFFRAVLTEPHSGGIVFTYRHNGELVGYNLCFVCGDKLVDKLIGLRYPQARQLNLYFISWIENLQYALAMGLKYYIAGWTDPQIKKDLGAEFTWTEHAVYVRNPLLRMILRRIRRHFQSDASWNERQGHVPAIDT